MRFTPTPIEGVTVVELQPRGDERGFFSRLFCEEEFAAANLETSFAQVNTSFSKSAGTLRGMHHQIGGSAEAKLVKCIAGSIFDVALDLRPESPTFGKFYGTTLSAVNRMMLYVPKGCAHGFLTLEDDTELVYFASNAYDGAAERIVRWNDPAFDIIWPRQPAVLSPKDAQAPDYRALQVN